LAGQFTDESVRALRADGKDKLRLEPGSGGFGVRVTPTGAKLFIAQARVLGRPCRVSLGTFPQISTAKARKLARDALADIRAGKDPRVERQARAKAIEAGQLTVDKFAEEEWLPKHVATMLRERTAADYESIFRKRISPAIGRLLLSQVSKTDVIELHVAMARTPRRANYVTRVVGSLFSYAEDGAKRPQNTNPAHRVRMYPEGKRERFMSETEIARAAEAIRSCEEAGTISRYAAGGLRLALLTGARSGEVTAARWDQVDWQRKFIRLPTGKSGARTIYLSDAAMEILRGLPRVGTFIIAGRRKGHKAKGGESDNVESYKNLGRAWIVVRAKAGLNDVRLHDLRHSYASVAAAKGHSLIMIGKLLGHRVQATTQRYAHLTVDAASAVSDELGVVFQAALDQPQNTTPTVVKWRRRDSCPPF
jgi:integrase